MQAEGAGWDDVRVPQQTPDAAERRELRRQSQSLFDALATAYEARPDVSRGMMFGSAGLKCSGTFIAFVGHDGRLIVKLPQDRVSAVIAAGAGDPVQPGARPMREWVGVPLGENDGTAHWRELLDEAYEFATRK